MREIAELAWSPVRREMNLSDGWIASDLKQAQNESARGSSSEWEGREGAQDRE